MPQSKTFGSLSFDDDQWTITAQPDVMIRLKRIFPRVQATKLGGITIFDSLEVSRDLEWVLDRWPMELSEVDERHLKRSAQGHREQQDSVTAILDGTAQHAEMPMAPAREMRDYQQTAFDMMEATGSLLLADDLGLGKTQSALALLSNPENRPMLAVVLNGLQRQWLKELGEIFPDLYGVEAKTTKPYDLSDDDGREPDLIVMNYAKMAGWSDHLAGRVRSVVFDEVQELRRSGSQKHTAAAMLASQSHRTVGLSATPVYNFGGEMHSIFSVLSPGAVGTASEFGREWCGSTYGLDRKTRIADPPAFRQWMTDQGIFLRRTREDVGISLPPLSVQEYPVDVDDDRWNQLLKTSDVARIAELILDDSTTHRQRWHASGDLDWKMRHATGVAKAPHVAGVAKLILESEQRIVIGGWHRECYDIWKELLADYNPVLYTGTESTAGKRRSFEAFTAGDSRVLMMSLRAGAGLDGLQGSCNVALFGELDWSPGIHKQLLGRFHRPGQINPVTGYFCVTDYGSDPIMLDALDLKKMEAELIINGPEATDREPEPVSQHDRVRQMAQELLQGPRAG